MNVLALDVGGTAIKSALFENGNLIQFQEMPSDGKLGRDQLLMNIHTCISRYQGFDAIGISTTGSIDKTNGIVLCGAENVPNYAGTDLKQIFETAFHVPVSVDNDVNAAAMGEAYFGVCTKESDFLCLTYGTGVGGAIVINRQVYQGSSGLAGELGHILTHAGGALCNCGKRGCYERYASTTALIEKASAYLPALTNGRLIFDQLQTHDVSMETILDEWIQEIVYGLVTLTHTFNPSCIVMGGGIMSQPYLLPRIQELLYDQILEDYRNVVVKTSSLDNKAGIYGMIAEILHGTLS